VEDLDPVQKRITHFKKIDEANRDRFYFECWFKKWISSDSNQKNESPD
jgi:hypothetical protein